MIKKISVLILIVLIAGFMISCAGNADLAGLPEHLIPYFSSKALYSIPADSFAIIKFDSIDELYDALEFDSLVEIFGENLDEKIKDIVDRTALIDNGYDTERPFILSARFLDNDEEVFSDKIFIQAALPFTNENKIKENLLEMNPEYEETKIGNYPFLYGNNLPAFLFKDKYVFFMGNANFDEGILLMEAEKIAELPQEESLRSSEIYKEHCLNINPDSIMNTYINYEIINEQDLDFDDLLYDYGFVTSSLDMLKELNFQQMDLYVYEKEMGVTSYISAKEGSDIYNNANISIPDIIKSIPDDLSMIFFGKTNTDSDALKSSIDLFDIYGKMFGMDFEILEDMFGMELDEFASIFNGETGMAISDLNKFPVVKMMISFGLQDNDKMSEVMVNFSNYLREEEGLEVIEKDGKYIIRFDNKMLLPYSITYGIVDDTLLIATSDEFFEAIVNTSGDITQKVNSEKLKEAINSDKCTSFFHTKPQDFIRAFSTFMGMFFGRDEVEALRSFGELLVEVNSFDYNMVDHYESVFEVIFDRENYFTELYKILSIFN
jgi:hypothetical protein